MYLIDLIGRLDSDLSGVRCLPAFRYYGNAIEDGIEPLAFLGVAVAAVAFAALGSLIAAISQAKAMLGF